MLLRLFRFREALSQDAASLYDAEFTDNQSAPDLELSVYQIEIGQGVQVCLEHHASAGADPPRFARGSDVCQIRDDGAVAETEAPFRLVRTSHRILRFEDADALKAFVQELVARWARDGVARLTEEKPALRAWLRERIAQRDPEWAQFLAREPSQRRWVPFSR